MANILVCIEDEEVNREAGTYYIKTVDPELSRLDHQIKLTTCGHLKTLLDEEQSDIIVFLVSKRQSLCWQTAHSLRYEWNLPLTPVTLMVIKWGPEDSDNPAYFNQPEYAGLYDDYYEGFTGIGWWVEQFIINNQLNRPGNGQQLKMDGPIVLSNLNDIFRYNAEKQNHLMELLTQYHQLVPHLYIIDGDGNVKVGQAGHHNHLAEGGMVYGAGEIFFTRNKEIVRIDDQTGNYYAPIYQGRTFGQQFKDYLKRLLTDRYRLDIADTVFRGTMSQNF